MHFELNKEQQDIIKAARKFALGEFVERALEFDRTETFDLALHQKACDLGFVGVFIDAEYGGAGYGFFEHCLINEEFWAVEPGVAFAIMSTTFGAEILTLFGSESQKKNILPMLAEGSAIIGTAITEPDAGSDVTMAATEAVLDGDHWVINGTKMFATNGNIADYMLLFCLTDPENPSRHNRHSFIMVPTQTRGYTSSKISGKLGIRASDTAELSLQNLKVPKDHLVGIRGQGFKQLMAFFNLTRLHICAQGVGLGRAALDESIRHVKGRMQYGQPLAAFQGIQFKIAEMATRVRAARNLYYEAAWRADNDKMDHSLVAMAKWYAGQTAVFCADEALQMHGGYGYIDEYKVQRLYRDAKILEIYEGTKEVEKMIVANGCLR